MGMVIGLIGLFGFFICLVMLVIALFKKKPKKNSLFGLGITFILFITGVMLTPDSEDREDASNNNSPVAEESDESITPEEDLTSPTPEEEKDSATETPTDVAEKPAQDEEIKTNPFGSISEKPVMNGSRTERIGTYATVHVSELAITEENLVDFYENVVKDSGYNWFTIILEDNKGIQFAGSNMFFTYGDIDDEACITNGLGDGFIVDGKVDYEER